MFIVVASGGDDRSFQGFVDEFSLSFPHISDATGEVFARFGVVIQHAVVVVAPDGTVETMLGAVDQPRLERVLTEVTS